VSDTEFYRARINELERELAQAYADIKMLEKKIEFLKKEEDEQEQYIDKILSIKLWELYRDERKICAQLGIDVAYDNMIDIAQASLKAWKEREK